MGDLRERLERRAYSLLQRISAMRHDCASIVRVRSAESVIDELGELQHVCTRDVAGVFVGELYAVDVGDVEESGTA